MQELAYYLDSNKDIYFTQVFFGTEILFKFCGSGLLPDIISSVINDAMRVGKGPGGFALHISLLKHTKFKWMAHKKRSAEAGGRGIWSLNYLI